MQLPAQIVARKQLIQTVGLTSAAFLIALPVGAAVLGTNGSLAGAQGTTTTVTKTVDDLGSCSTGAGTGSPQKSTVTTVTKAAPAVTQTGGSGINQNGTGNQASQNDHGATAQASDHSIAAAINVGDVLSNNEIPVLSNNTVNAPVSVPVSVPVLGTSTVTNLLGGLGL